MHQPGTDATIAIGGEVFAAGVFDLDGVVTRTARIHAAAWKQLFDEFLAHRGGQWRPFDVEADYREFVDGKPRLDGVRAFLRARGIELPEGAADDPPGETSIHALGKRKNEIFRQLLAQGRVEVVEGSVEFIRRLRQAGVRTALVSSSRNSGAVLDAAGLRDLFDLCVDGNAARRLGLAGKPAADMFRHAAAGLGVAPARAFAVEDAISGVEAARAAGFGLVIGFDSGGHAGALRAHGADMVVSDLRELLSPQPIPDALEHFAEIAQRLADKQPAVFLDYDGTLTPIVARPDLAVLSEAMREAVRALAASCTVAIVSGRDRADVERLVGIPELIYAGSHGFDIAGPGGLRKQHKHAAAFQAALDRAEASLREALADIDGALLERKRFALAAHYRLVAPEQVAAVDAAVEAVHRASVAQLRRTGGKKVFELRPNLPWDKGRAVEWLLRTLGLDRHDVLPLYLGDDETDEDAFAALRARGGIGVLVSEEPAPHSAAHYRLRDPDAVGAFLRALVEAARA